MDFDETFSPVAMQKSIRIMLAIAAYYDYEIWLMDVKTAFLNGDIDKDIYMEQPIGFTFSGSEQKVSTMKQSKRLTSYKFRMSPVCIERNWRL